MMPHSVGQHSEQHNIGAHVITLGFPLNGSIRATIRAVDYGVEYRGPNNYQYFKSMV